MFKTQKAINILLAQITRNPCLNQKKLALQMNMSKSTVRKALKQDLKLKTLKQVPCDVYKCSTKRESRPWKLSII